MKNKSRIGLIIFTLLLFFGVFGVVGAEKLSPDFEIKIKSTGGIPFNTLGIQSFNGIGWGTEKFAMTVDDGETLYIVYCLNNDLDTNTSLLNQSLSTFDHLFNQENIKKILYYGYGGPGYDEETKNKIMNDPEYKIWMPLNGDWVADQWSDDLLYVLNHLALSYSYYNDVMKLDAEEVENRAFREVLQSSDSYGADGTRARSVAKMWYDALIAKPYVGIKLSSEQNESITYTNSGASNPLSIKFNEKISVSGMDVATGGRIEFVVPANVNCVVTGNISGASAAGTYDEGEKLTLGSGQSFSFHLIKDVKEVENLHINFYENYSVAKVDGGASEDLKTQYQDLAGLYPSGDRALAIELKFDGPYDYINPETGGFVSCFIIACGIICGCFMIYIATKNKKFNKI